MSEPKIYAPQEEKLNVMTHMAGVICALPALAGLLYYAAGPLQWITCILYILSMTVMFWGSSMYHAEKDPARRARLRKFDHSSIYFLIAGTYTPLMLLCVPGLPGFIVLAAVWLIAAVGISFEVFGIKPFRGFSLILYLIAGWLCIAVMHTLIRNMPTVGLIFLAAGGVAYTSGVVFYVNRRMYSHAIWHVFVIGGVVFHYFAVLSVLKH